MPVRDFLPPAWWTAGTRGVESLSACTAVYWGIVLLIPVDSFAVSYSFSHLQSLASENAWAMVYGGIGVFQLLALILVNYQMRLVAAVCAASLWIMTAVSIFINAPASTTVGVYFALSMGCVWTLLRGPSLHRSP